jgi:antirestriction protein ArdC
LARAARTLTGRLKRRLPENALTHHRYNGINVVSLWVAAESKGYGTPIWASYKQWAALGAQVRGGEKASLVVFYKEFSAEPNPDDEQDDGTRRVARASYVFNADQVDGFADAPKPPEPLMGPIERIAQAERFLEFTRAKIEVGGERAFYRPSTDVVQMPDENLFIGTDSMNRSEAWYATALHECTHWSGAKHRLNRDFGKRLSPFPPAACWKNANAGAANTLRRMPTARHANPSARRPCAGACWAHW